MFSTRSATLATLAIALALPLLAACSASTDSTATSAGTTAASSTPPTTATPTTAIPTTTTTAPPIDPGTLPQTEDKPMASGEQWDADSRALWDAIVTDDPAKALPFFFPLSAYKQVKAISNPEGDYDSRLIAYYEEDIHALHKKLGANASAAQFVKLEVPATAQWIKPGVEYNKGAYFRVFDSKVLYTVDGKQQSFLVKSMISWRGQWYVVHLTSIR